LPLLKFQPSYIQKRFRIYLFLAIPRRLKYTTDIDCYKNWWIRESKIEM